MRKPMTRFLSRLTCFASIQFLILGVVLYRGSPDDDQHYMCALADKVERLEQCHSHRLLMVGGSNVAFGIHSPMLQKATGRETVNLGMHMMLGLGFQVECVRQHAQAGDVVVLMPEYHLLASPYQEGQSTTVLQLTERWPASTRYFDEARYGSWKAFLDHDALTKVHESLKVAWRKKRHQNEAIYRRSNFNVHGDMVAHHGRQSRAAMQQKEPLPPINAACLDHAIEVLNELSRVCEKRGVDLFLSYPPIPEARFSQSKDVIAEIHESFQKRLTIPLLNEPDEFVYPLDHFFDTTYHLTSEGGAKRTASVMNGLMAVPSVATASASTLRR